MYFPASNFPGICGSRLFPIRLFPKWAVYFPTRLFPIHLFPKVAVYFPRGRLFPKVPFISQDLKMTKWGAVYFPRSHLSPKAKNDQVGGRLFPKVPFISQDLKWPSGGLFISQGPIYLPRLKMTKWGAIYFPRPKKRPFISQVKNDQISEYFWPRLAYIL